MLAVIIFMMLVYRESLKESCLSYEKLVNEIEKICNRWKKCRRNYEDRNWDIYFTEGIRFLI